MASKIVQAAEKLSKAVGKIEDDLSHRLWFGHHFGRLLSVVERIYSFTHANSRRFELLCKDVIALRESFEQFIDELAAEDDETNWVTVVVRDPDTHFAMGYTLRVGPGTVRQVILAPHREFPAGSIYEIQTESPGIALVEIRVGAQSMVAGTLVNAPKAQCSIRSGKLTEACPVGSHLRLDVCNHRTERETEEP